MFEKNHNSIRLHKTAWSDLCIVILKRNYAIGKKWKNKNHPSLKTTCFKKTDSGKNLRVVGLVTSPTLKLKIPSNFSQRFSTILKNDFRKEWGDVPPSPPMGPHLVKDALWLEHAHCYHLYSSALIESQCFFIKINNRLIDESIFWFLHATVLYFMFCS